MARNFLTSSRHGSIYYFRRRVPKDLDPIIGKSHIFQTLNTSHRNEATVLARALAVKTDVIFQRLRAMKKKADEGFQVDYTLALEFDDSGSIRKLHVDAQADESEAVAIAIKAALQSRSELPPVSHGRSLPIAGISASELYENYFHEGIGSSRWKDADSTRQYDYNPIWARFSVHVQTHGLTVAAAKAYRAEVLSTNLALKTKFKSLSRVHSVIVYGVEHHDLDEKMLTSLKFSRQVAKSNKSKSNNYLPFTNEELELLFHSEQYQKNSFKKPSQYWLPLLGLYTGARLEELAGLHLNVFFTLDGIPVVRLSDVETTDGGKNEFSLREVPLHDQLIKAGLLDYIELLRVEGHERLFPDIGEAERDGFGKRATVDFMDYRRSVGVGKEEGVRSRQVFHSFRSNLAKKFYDVGIDGDLSRRLTGHAANDTHQDTYLRTAPIPVGRAAIAMNSISYGLVHPPFQDKPAYKKKRLFVKAKSLAKARLEP